MAKKSFAVDSLRDDGGVKISASAAARDEWPVSA